MSQFSTMRQQLRDNGAAFWQARTEQERRFLGVGGALLGVLLAYGVLIAPALDGREQLRKDLPTLRQQAAELQALALQAGALKAQPAVTPPPMTHDSVADSLKASGLTAQSLAMTGEYAKLQLKGVPFSGLIAWLDAQRRDSHVDVLDATITAQDTAGMVDAALTLHQGAAR
ncbi:type II secretion system protein M [Rugamonas sp.]|uniref:type II secretion system protein M n=1 Tax=Rugamonas sp. TaxID=1926287 RepID=UPI0025DC227C|nr:type II secretion system protein M [Rugamonas sp.]